LFPKPHNDGNPSYFDAKRAAMPGVKIWTELEVGLGGRVIFFLEGGGAVAAVALF
jgi:hypothetical protein